MATSWKSQQGDGMYSLQFETDDIDKYKLVEKASQMAIDGIADVAEVKHGNWIYDHWCEFKCSICGHWSQTEPRGKERYCPNCGAKMDGIAVKEDSFCSQAERKM